MLRRARAFAAGLGIATVVLSYFPGAAGAQDAGAIWSQSSFDADGGGRSYTLQYAIPETDAWAFYAVCNAGRSDDEAIIELSLPLGQRTDGAQVAVQLSADDYGITLPGRVFRKSEEYEGISASLPVAGHPFWSALSSATFLNYQVLGDEPRTIPLAGAMFPLRRFVSRCGTNADPADEVFGPFSYSCEDGTNFTARFTNGTRSSHAVLSLAGREIRLEQVPSGSGSRYALGEVEMHAKGENALMIYGDETIRCSQLPSR